MGNEMKLCDFLIDCCKGLTSNPKFDKTVLKEGGESARRAVDDVHYRNTAKDGYRMSKFKDNAIIKDEYTGRNVTIYKELSDSAVSLAQVDHIVPLNQIIFENKNKAFLTVDDIREISNKDYNLALTESKLNQSKQDSSNADFAELKLLKGEINQKTAETMIKKEQKARKELNKNIKNRQIKNASGEFFKSAGNNILENSVEFSWDIIHNIIRACEEEISKEEAINNVCHAGKEMLARATSSGTMCIVAEYVSQKEGKIAKVLQKTGDKPEIVSCAAGICTITVDNVFKYMKGEISIEECENHVLSQAVHIVGEVVANKKGRALGTYLAKKLSEKVAKGVSQSILTGGVGFLAKLAIDATITAVENYITGENEKSKQTESAMRQQYSEILKQCEWYSIKMHTVSCGVGICKFVGAKIAEHAMEAGLREKNVKEFLGGINALNFIYGNRLSYNELDFKEFCEYVSLVGI